MKREKDKYKTLYIYDYMYIATLCYNEEFLQ